VATRGAADRAGIIDLDESAALVQQLARRGYARHGFLRSFTAEKTGDLSRVQCWRPAKDF